MKRAVFVAALALVSWLVFGAHDSSWAQEGASSVQARQRALSEKVRLLSPGSEITVHLNDGSKVEAVIREVQDDAIVVEPKGGKPTTIMLADIQRLQVKGKGHKVAYVVLGTVVGLIVVAASAC